MKYTAQKLATLANISVRTLHYYDEIGLLKPSFIKSNGYRVYEDVELARLQQILFFRELEFPLEDILKIMTSTNFKTVEALVDQKKLLELKMNRLAKLAQAVEKTIQTMKGNTTMTNDDMFASFADDQMKEYAAEAKKRWGNTDAYKQSMERTKHWTKTDYQNATQNWKIFMQKLAKAVDNGIESEQFQQLIKEQHQSIEQYYDCSLEMYRELGKMYVADERFRQNYDKYKPGLAEAVRDGIAFYCDHQTSTSSGKF